MRFCTVLLLVNILLVGLLLVELYRPSNDHVWQLDQAILAKATFSDDLVTIANVRNFTYVSTTEYTPSYYDATYNLSEINEIHFLQEDISSIEALAHTMLSFSFKDGRQLVVSVEARKEPDEHYHPLPGLLRQYELIYVIGDESDLVRLRTNYRNDTVRMYPIKTTPATAKALLTSMLVELNFLHTRPQFYNTFTSTCTTNLVKHANRATLGRIPLRTGVLLPGYADRLAYDLGLIDTTLSFEEAREYYRIENQARTCGTCGEFSTVIRTRKVS